MTRDAQDTCDPSRLRLLLDGALSASEEAALTLHLDRCSICRDRLEALTASPQEWQQVRGLRQQSDDSHTGDQKADDVPLSQTWPLNFLGPTDDPAMLGRLGLYEVIGVIGEGGMAIVLKVFDRALNRNVAVKVLAPQLAAAAAARRRFAREAQAAAAVVHEHVIAIHAVAEFNGFPYLVMPYIAGGSLQHRIDSVGPLSLVEILRIGAQTAAGLAAAHAQGLVHRDIKPANILLENGVERVVITDFGLARAVDDATFTCSGMISGTPQYMAPEQAQGEAIDHRADLFSLGSVLYTMCTGRPPFRAQTAVAVMRRICEDEPRCITQLNPEIPAWLERIVGRLLAKNPADRFQAAAEVSKLLEKCLAHVQNPGSHPLPSELRITRLRLLLDRSRIWQRSRWRSIAALLFVPSISIAVYLISQSFPSEAPGPPVTNGASKDVESVGKESESWDAQPATKSASSQGRSSTSTSRSSSNTSTSHSSSNSSPSESSAQWPTDP
ncbi:MAG: protein kinase [Pirellulales bacterium]